MSTELPLAEKQRRLQLITTWLEQNRAQAVIIPPGANLRWATGFPADSTWAVIDKNKQQYLITDSRFTEQANKSCPDCKVILWHKNSNSSITKAIAAILKSSNVEIAILSEDILVKQLIQLQQELDNSTRLVFVSQLSDSPLSLLAPPPDSCNFSLLRRQKSAWEIEQIATALKIASTAFEKTLTKIYPNSTERDLQAELNYQMLRAGAEELAFPTIVATGANSSLPHHLPETTTIKPGQPLLFDFGACVNGYCSDLTRTVFPVSIDKIWIERYNATLQAQELALQKLKAGATGSDIHNIAVAVLAEFKLDSYFVHGLGHGVGLEIHEEPRLSKYSRQTLATGDVITIEPGVYFPGQGGIRIEDTCFIDSQGTGQRIIDGFSRNIQTIQL